MRLFLEKENNQAMLHAKTAPSLKTVLLASGLVLTLAMGMRHGLGFWLQPISMEHGWTREPFSMAIAVQNLMWGIFSPFAGMVADRFGTAKVVLTGAILYASGLVWMALVNEPVLFIIGSGILVGGALAATTFAAISGIIGRSVSPEKRSWAFGLSSAAGSFGQFLMMPVEQKLIAATGWQHAFFWLALLLLAVMIPMAFKLREPPLPATAGTEQSVTEAFKEALSHGSFQLLLAGYFVCGFQLVFIGTHLPSYLQDKGIINPNVSVTALALIGLCNIFGSYYAGKWGGIFQKRYLLSIIYFSRSIAIGLFLLAPLSPLSVYLFAAAMGFLWLSTVPLTNGIIASIFGLKYLSMLSGLVFLSHQLGSFLGAWLGGYMFTRQGNYNTIWVITLLLGVFAALVNLPIKERAIVRTQTAIV